MIDYLSVNEKSRSATLHRDFYWFDLVYQSKKDDSLCFLLKVAHK